MSTDPVAGAIHAERAERAYAEAEKFRKLGRTRAEAAAREEAATQDRLAYMLRTGKEPPRRPA